MKREAEWYDVVEGKRQSGGGGRRRCAAGVDVNAGNLAEQRQK
jgi:hypothetical protein